MAPRKNASSVKKAYNKRYYKGKVSRKKKSINLNKKPLVKKIEMAIEEEKIEMAKTKKKNVL